MLALALGLADSHRRRALETSHQIEEQSCQRCKDIPNVLPVEEPTFPCLVLMDLAYSSSPRARDLGLALCSFVAVCPRGPQAYQSPHATVITSSRVGLVQRKTQIRIHIYNAARTYLLLWAGGREANARGVTAKSLSSQLGLAFSSFLD